MVTVDTDGPVGTEPQWVYAHRGAVGHSGGDTVGHSGSAGAHRHHRHPGVHRHPGAHRDTQGHTGTPRGHTGHTCTSPQGHRQGRAGAQTHRHKDTETQSHRDAERHRYTETQRHRDTETERQRSTETVGRWVGVGDVVPRPHEMTICHIP